nr:uncharacterized protein LOC129167238 [Nothobranchius furzeri]
MNEMDLDNDETNFRDNENEKRQRKFSVKGLAFEIEKLQKERSYLFKQANKIKAKIKDLCSSSANFIAVKQHLQGFSALCKNASSLHDTLLKEFSLPEDEQQRQNAWFKDKSAANEAFVNEVCSWLKENEVLNENENADDEPDAKVGVKEYDEHFDCVKPEDSASNVSKRSRKSSRASGSSTSSACKLVMAEKAALIEKAAALKRRHELEEQEEKHRLEAEKLRKQKEQMELEAQIAAASIKLSVLEGSDVGRRSCSNGMNSYVSKGLREQRQAEFNPQAKECVPKGAVFQLSSTAPLVSEPDARPKTVTLKSSAPTQFKQQKLKMSIQSESLQPQSSQNQQQNPVQIFSPVDNNAICAIMQKQNEITAMLVQHQLSATLPQREIPVFDGNPLQCISFFKAFEHCVEGKTSSYQDCLYFLEQYTRGQPRELVRSCMHMPSQQGYQKAKGLLMEHFGNEHKIATAYMDKVICWPAIKTEEIQALQDFALFLRGCCNAMSDIHYMEELNLPSYMRQVILKWPYKLREKWRTAACELQERRGFRATFTDMVTFLEHQVKILSHPLFVDISETRPSLAAKEVPRNKGSIKTNIKGSTFVTAIAPSDCAISSPSVLPKPQVQPVATRSPAPEACPYCDQSHSLMKCPKLTRIPQKDKIEFLKGKGICFGCFKVGHMSKECKNRLTCDKCNRKHPTILHSDKEQAKAQETPVSSALVSHKADVCTDGGEDCTLSIVPVKIKSKKGDQVFQTYAFLDPGSTATFITNKLKKKLNVQGPKINILLRTMGQERLVSSCFATGLEISGLQSNSFVELPEVYTQEAIPVSRNNIPLQRDVEKWDYLSTIRIPELNADVELLIGMNASNLMEPWEIINSQGNGPYAVRTPLGWVINGPLRSSVTTQKGCTTVNANRISVAKLEELLISQYNQDFDEKTLEEKHEMSIEDKKFMEIMENSACTLDGHYCLDLPFKKDDIIMPNNRCVMAQRLQTLKRKFERNKVYKKEYTALMMDLINKGYAEKVPLDQMEPKEGKVWYLPHHGVYHPRKRTLRVVFDCGASYKGSSLNGQLLQGPDLTNSLFGVLTRFRQENIALMTDVQAMFHQVKVSEKHLDFLRFLWWPLGDTSVSPMEYRMTVHLFGAVSSPSCANYALRQTATDNIECYHKEVTDTVYNNFYVDDCLKSVAMEETAVKLAEDLTELCSKGGFELSKWTSTSRAVLSSIPEQKRSNSTRQLHLERDSLPVEKALGLSWCAESDTFIFQLVMEERPHTRRGILSMVSSIYDPLGFLAPFTLLPKLLLQEMCRRKMSWDEPVSQTMSQQWTLWLQDLQKITEFNVSRCIKPKHFEEPLQAQLHHFADASEHGYGTVSYLRLQDEKGNVHLAFMLGKARVAPLKQTTIPRLELTAAVLAVKVDRMLRKELSLDLTYSYFWTDSQTLLKYIHNENKRFYTFVANRVAAIREATDVWQWRYVASKLNPADEASRGLTAHNFMACQRWIAGPAFLQKPEKDWPEVFNPKPVSLEDPEVKGEVIVNVFSLQADDPTSRFIHYFSSWRKLKTSVAWFLKLKAILLDLSQKRKEFEASLPAADVSTFTKKAQENTKRAREAVCTQTLSVNDLFKAESAIIWYCQSKRFKEEISTLESGASVVKTRSNIYKLDPILKNGLLRVGGRLRRSAIPQEQKHPAILTKDQHVSKLILQHIHQQLGHAGRNHMLSALRKRYWITSANSACRKIISECVICKRQRAQPSWQKMSDMPEERISPDLPPFTNVGVDYFGPIEVKRGRAIVKRYGVIFTCMASRAIHLEVAHSLTTDSCINAIRRFICRRGPVSQMRSDNGTNFIGAERELREALASVEQNKIHPFLLTKEIDWTFNPPAASHHGGVWERLIRMVRKVLFSVLQQQSLDDENLQTFLCEVEAILNDRPITKVSDEANDLEALTPNHILLLKGSPILAPGVFEERDCYIRKRWKQVQYLADLFWKRWTREYLPLLQERQKWSKPQRNFTVGDVIVVMDHTAPRGSWILGRIINTYPDKNGLVRAVQLKTKTGQLERPISKICLLQAAV